MIPVADLDVHGGEDAMAMKATERSRVLRAARERQSRADGRRG
jgi:hypothetical protein